jgi:hypothetical protein
VKVDEVKVNTACLDNCENACLNNYVKPKSKDHLKKQTQAKFVPTCHHCGIVGYIRSNCYLLKSQRPWNKQDAPKKGKVEQPSKSKYVPPHMRYLSQKGKGIIIYKNANIKSAEPVMKHSNKRNLSTCHYCGITGHIRQHCPQIHSQKPRINK